MYINHAQHNLFTAFKWTLSFSVAFCGQWVCIQLVCKEIKQNKTMKTTSSFFYPKEEQQQTFRLTSNPRQPERFRSWMLRHSLTETKEGLLRCWQSRMLRWMRYMRALGSRLVTILSVTLPCTVWYTEWNPLKMLIYSVSASVAHVASIQVSPTGQISERALNETKRLEYSTHAAWIVYL